MNKSAPHTTSKRTVLWIIATLCFGILTATGLILWQTPTVKIAYYDWRMRSNYDKAFNDDNFTAILLRKIGWYDFSKTHDTYEHHRDRLVELEAITIVFFQFQHIGAATEESRHIWNQVTGPDAPPMVDGAGLASSNLPYDITVWSHNEHAEAWRQFLASKDIPDYRTHHLPHLPPAPPYVRPPKGEPAATVPANDTALAMVGHWVYGDDDQHAGAIALIIQQEDDQVVVTDPDYDHIYKEHFDAEADDGEIRYTLKTNMDDMMVAIMQEANGIEPNDDEDNKGAKSLRPYSPLLDTTISARLRLLETGQLECHYTIALELDDNLSNATNPEEETVILTRKK
jgi:hypothetical protein